MKRGAELSRDKRHVLGWCEGLVAAVQKLLSDFDHEVQQLPETRRNELDLLDGREGLRSEESKLRQLAREGTQSKARAAEINCFLS